MEENNIHRHMLTGEDNFYLSGQKEDRKKGEEDVSVERRAKSEERRELSVVTLARNINRNS